MTDETTLYETKNYRCIEYRHDIFQDLYMELCGIEQCLPGKKYGPAIRDGYHLHAVISGRGRLRIDGEEFEVQSGQLFVTVPGKEVFYQADEKEPWYYCWITYDGAKVKELLESAGFTDGVYVRDSMTDMEEYLSVLQALLKRPDLKFSSDIYRLGLGYHFLSLAIESCEKEEPVRARHNQMSPDDYVEYAVDYIRGNYSNVKISTVAEYIGVNRSYLTAIFKNKMCMSPQEYLMQVRMNKGKDLLLHSDFPVHVIARSIGYDNQLTFSKIFKQKFGVSPEYYRKQQRK